MLPWKARIIVHYYTKCAASRQRLCKNDKLARVTDLRANNLFSKDYSLWSDKRMSASYCVRFKYFQRTESSGKFSAFTSNSNPDWDWCYPHGIFLKPVLWSGYWRWLVNDVTFVVSLFELTVTLWTFNSVARWTRCVLRLFVGKRLSLPF